MGSVRGKTQVEDPRAVTRECFDVFIIMGFVNFDLCVVRATEDKLGIRSKRHSPDRQGVSPNLSCFTRLDIEHVNKTGNGPGG